MATVTQNETVQEPCSCPYWSPLTGCCLLAKDDLFIPLKDHALIYCLSSRFSWCSYYLELEGCENQTDFDKEKAINNRRSIRTPYYNRLSCLEFVDRNTFKEVNSNSWTSDTSEHGIGFVSQKFIYTDKIILFCVEEEMPYATIRGYGKVIWCKCINKKYLFRVGVAITWLLQ